MGCGSSGTGYWYALREASLRRVATPFVDVRLEAPNSGLQFDIEGRLTTPSSLGIVIAAQHAAAQPIQVYGVQGALLLDPLRSPGLVFFPAVAPCSTSSGS